MTRFLRFQFPLLFWIGVIFFLSSLSSVPTVKLPISPDKIAHIIIFFILCAFARRAFYNQDRFNWLKRNALTVGFVFSSLYGVIDELHQLYVPGRSADEYDVLADVIGAALFFFWQQRKGRTENRTNP